MCGEGTAGVIRQISNGVGRAIYGGPEGYGQVRGETTGEGLAFC